MTRFYSARARTSPTWNIESNSRITVITFHAPKLQLYDQKRIVKVTKTCSRKMEPTCRNVHPLYDSGNLYTLRYADHKCPRAPDIYIVDNSGSSKNPVDTGRMSDRTFAADTYTVRRIRRRNRPKIRYYDSRKLK